MKGKVVSVNISDKKGVRKKPVGEAYLKTDFGMKAMPMLLPNGTGR